MAAWRFLAFDLRTEAFLAELPMTRWRSSDPLKGIGSFVGEVVLDGAAAGAISTVVAQPLLDDDTDEQLLDDDTGHVLVDDPTLVEFSTSRRTTIADATRKGRTWIVAERNGIPVFDGVLWDRYYQATSRTLRIAGANLSSYFDHFSVTSAIGPFAGIEQLSIFRAFVDNVQNRTGSDIGIVTHSETSGVARDRTTYEAYSGKKIGELMSELSAVQNGFDYSIGAEYNAGAIERHLRLFYPRRGREQAATGLRFTAPGNALLYDMDDPGHDMATVIVELGAGDGEDMLVTTAARTDLIDAGWPGYEQTRARKDVLELTTLAEHAQADVDRTSGIDREQYQIQVNPSSLSQPFGSWTMGDDAELVIADDPLFPAQQDGSPGLVASRRVVRHDWAVDRLAESLIVTLGEKVIP